MSRQKNHIPLAAKTKKMAFGVDGNHKKRTLKILHLAYSLDISFSDYNCPGSNHFDVSKES